MNDKPRADHRHRRLARDASLVAAAFFAVACAPMVPTQPVDLVSAGTAEPSRRIRLSAPVVVTLSTGYGRTLVAGSRWRAVGRVAQGEVYRPEDGVLTIEGRQVHEAYLVLDGKALTGFYLPGESRYSPLSPAIPLNFTEEP